MYRSAAPNEAVIIPGRRKPKVLVGEGRAFVGWSGPPKSLSLELLYVPLHVEDASSRDGVNICLDLLALVQVDNKDDEKLLTAARMFLDKPSDKVVEILKGIIEGHIRSALYSKNELELRNRDDVFRELSRGVSARLVNLGMELQDFFLNDIKLGKDK